jgi:predicted TIM-barrel fold metal-dependent hydrolase
MLVDINAYIGHWPFLQLQYNNCSGILGRMNRFGIDVSVVSNLNGIFYKNTQSANQELYDELKSNKQLDNRFISFAVINPIYAGWRDDLITSLDMLGMKGVRLYPKYHDYALDDPACIELIKRVRDRGFPVAFSLRMVDNRQRSWMDIQEEWSLKDVVSVVRAVPDAKYMILNLANGANLTADDAAILKDADVLLDTSGRAISNLSELLSTYGKDKFAFGTHAPILDYLTGLLRIEAMRENEADHGTKQLLRSGNAKRFLNL